MQTLILRMKLPELQFEGIVSIPTPIFGEIPEHYIAHIFGLYPAASVIEFFDGQNVRKYEKEDQDVQVTVTPAAGVRKQKTALKA